MIIIRAEATPQRRLPRFSIAVGARGAPSWRSEAKRKPAPHENSWRRRAAIAMPYASMAAATRWVRGHYADIRYRRNARRHASVNNSRLRQYTISRGGVDALVAEYDDTGSDKTAHAIYDRAVTGSFAPIAAQYQ